MPNTGKPSKDCHTCRKRRVKCTLERPECQRCIRIGKKCPGYRDEQSLMFKNEDPSSFSGPSSTRDRRRGRSGDSSEVESSTSGAPSRRHTPLHPPARSDWSFRGIKLSDLDPIVFGQNQLMSPPSMSLHQWSHYAVPLVLSMFSYEAEGQRIFAKFQTLPSLLSRCPENSPLILCFEALGIAYLTNRFFSPEAESIRDHAYGRALAAANALVGDAELCRQDETAISVWLLGLYEVMAGSQHSTARPSTVTWSIHAQGQVELLRLRGPDQLKTPDGRKIFWYLTMSGQVRSLITGAEYPSFIRDWLTESQDDLVGCHRTFLALSTFANHLTVIGARIQEALNTDDTQFLAWTIEDLWTEILTLETTLDQALYDFPLGEPTNLDNLYISNMYRTYYTRTLQHMFDLAESPQARQSVNIEAPHLDQIIEHLQTTVQNLASATLSTVPMILTGSGGDYGSTTRSPPLSPPRLSRPRSRPIGWSDILQLLWPLRIICARKQLLQPTQGDFAQTALERMSDEFGIRQAVAAYDLLDRDPGWGGGGRRS